MTAAPGILRQFLILPSLSPATSTLKLRKTGPPKPDSSGKPGGEERAEDLERIAGTHLYSSTEPALLENKIE